ncbi:MAG: DNA starvation/stationary phase protection protein [Proteobacteria bacterium]|nr:DNA starvation/stationary phase protection protein [Pseudomonadota bacterium]
MQNVDAVAQALSGFLASTYTLYQKSLFYHWNVTGENFVGLHSLFEQHYEELHKAGDALAERIRALGHFAPGTLGEFCALTQVEEDKKLPSDARQMIMNLLESHEICSQEARLVLKAAEDAEDDVTADLMIERMAFHDKAAWMLRALSK